MTPYYERDGITIYHADCRDILPMLGPVDHIITDPPFARDVYQRLGASNLTEQAGNKGRVGSRINHQYSSISIERLAAGAIGYIDEMLEGVASEIARLTTRWAIVFSDVETCHRWREALTGDGQMRYVRTGAWVKTDPMPQFSGDRPAVGFEPCTIVHANGPMHWNGGGNAATWTYGTVKTDRPDHPCPKPLPLMRELVQLFSDPSELILDPFMGSGTTLRAAKDLGRRAIGIEIEEKYCEIAVKRLAQEVLAL